MAAMIYFEFPNFYLSVLVFKSILISADVVGAKGRSILVNWVISERSSRRGSRSFSVVHFGHKPDFSELSNEWEVGMKSENINHCFST